MNTNIENAINLFPNLHRAYEVSFVSGLMIKPFNHVDYHTSAALADLKASGAMVRMSESGELYVEIHRPQFSDLYSLRKFESTAEIEERLEALRTGDFPLELESPNAAKLLLKTAWDRLGLSVGDYNIINHTARAIAKLDHSRKVKTEHIAEAIHYRSIGLPQNLEANSDAMPLKLQS